MILTKDNSWIKMDQLKEIPQKKKADNGVERIWENSSDDAGTEKII